MSHFLDGGGREPPPSEEREIIDRPERKDNHDSKRLVSIWENSNYSISEKFFWSFRSVPKDDREKILKMLEETMND